MTDHPSNCIAHFNISGPDGAALRDFYQGIFGWVIEEQGPGYALVETPGASPNGAIIEGEEAALTIGVIVNDIDATLRSAVEHGGIIAMPVVDNGWVRKAMLIDPAGNRLSVIQG